MKTSWARAAEPGIVVCAAAFAVAPSSLRATPMDGPPQEHVTSGEVSASLFYTHKQYKFENLRLQIARGGVILLDQRVPPYPTHPAYGVAPAGFGTHRSISIRDVDGDGEPEVILDLYWGGAHCCYWSRVYRYDGSRKAYVVALHFWGDPFYRVRDLNHDGKPELITADDRFAYRFTSFAFSGMPVEIWSYRHGTFTSVTRGFSAAIRSDSTRQWRCYLDEGRRYHEYRGCLASWSADQDLLGHTAKVERALTSALRRGQLGTRASGRAYIRGLTRFLRATGYLRG